MWGGAVIFDRTDLDEQAFLTDLRQTISDDGLLGEHVDITPIRRGREVPIGGAVRQTIERHVRFNKISATRDPGIAAVSFVGLVVVVVGCGLYSILAVGLTALVGSVYVEFGVHRATALLTMPALAVAVPLGAYAMAREIFVHGGRRYRWRSKFDVEALPA